MEIQKPYCMAMILCEGVYREPITGKHLNMPLVTDPLIILEGFCGISVAFPKPGTYHCELHSGGEHLMSRRLIVDGPQPGPEMAEEKND